MNKDTTYKKLAEVCDVKTGKLDANASNEDGLYPFFTCSKEPLRINTYSYDAECILVAGNGDLNVKYYNGKFDAYQRTYIITLKKGITDICVRYLYCFFLLYVETLRKKSIGGVIKYIKLGDITEAKVYIPSLAEQQRIVSELDLLQSIIDKQQAQLKELDKLAQAVFYDMFGDPVENEKGWDVKKLGDFATSKIGLTYKPTDVCEDGTIVLRSSNIQQNKIDLDDIVRVNTSIKEGLWVKDGDILMCTRNGSFRLVGKVAMIKNLPEKMTYGAFMTIIRSEYNHYLLAFFRTPAFRRQLGCAGTATINQITVKMLNEILVPLPTLSTQQSFAAKIESIEKQKAAISQSIAETQKLFDYTMDKYFG